jgi:hypothetical protein
MQKLENIFSLTNIIKILVIFSVGFISRIIVYHYLDDSIYILYYFGISSILVYFDQFFSYQYNGPLNVEPANIKSFTDYSKGSLLFQKDSANSSKLVNMQTNRVSNPRDLDYSSVKRQIMQDVQTKIKEAEIVKGAETVREAKPVNKVHFAKEIV